MVIFRETHQTLSLSDIEDVEQNLAIELPNDLRNHYLLYNGGRPNPRFFLKDNEWYDIQCFLPMKSVDKNIGFEETYTDLVLCTLEFPKGFIPFAVDEAGDYFLYCINTDHFGYIMFNQSDYINEPHRFLVTLTENLESFLLSLTDPY